MRAFSRSKQRIGRLRTPPCIRECFAEMTLEVRAIALVRRERHRVLEQRSRAIEGETLVKSFEWTIESAGGGSWSNTSVP